MPGWLRTSTRGWPGSLPQGRRKRRRWVRPPSNARRARPNTLPLLQVTPQPAAGVNIRDSTGIGSCQVCVSIHKRAEQAQGGSHLLNVCFDKGPVLHAMSSHSQPGGSWCQQVTPTREQEPDFQARHGREKVPTYNLQGCRAVNHKATSLASETCRRSRTAQLPPGLHAYHSEGLLLESLTPFSKSQQKSRQGSRHAVASTTQQARRLHLPSTASQPPPQASHMPACQMKRNACTYSLRVSTLSPCSKL